MKKNVASQVVGAQLNSKTDGSEVTTGTTTVYVTGDGGTQATGSVGSGACTHEGHGFWTYAPAQAETNYDHVAFTFANTSAVSTTVQIYPSFPQTGDSFARIGAPVGASISADVAAVQADTDNIQTRLPAALVSGRMDSSVGAMAAGVVTAAAIATNAIDADALATDAVTEIQSGLATAASITTLTGYVDTEVAAIKAVTDKLDTTLVADGGVYQFTANALELAPTGGSAPTAAAIADAVWDEAIADHLDAGSTGEALNGATAAGNPWLAVLEAPYTAGDLLRINAGVAAGKTSITDTGSDTATVVFRDVTDASDIVTASMDHSERIAMTLAP